MQNNLHEKKVLDSLFFLAQTNINKGQIITDLSKKNLTQEHNSIHNYLLENTSMENGLNVEGLKTSNFQCLRRKTAWFSGWYSLTTGNQKTQCFKS